MVNDANVITTMSLPAMANHVIDKVLTPTDTPEIFHAQPSAQVHTIH